MNGLDIPCKFDISDEDCRKCLKYGIIFHCPDDCPEYIQYMSRFEDFPEE